MVSVHPGDKLVTGCLSVDGGLQGRTAEVVNDCMIGVHFSRSFHHSVLTLVQTDRQLVVVDGSLILSVRVPGCQKLQMTA